MSSNCKQRAAFNLDYLRQRRLGGKCEMCGMADPRVLQFHHREESTHSLRVYARAWSIARLKIELAKCELLCANCHIIRHSDENSGYFAQRNEQ